MVSRVNADSLPPVHRYRGPRACKPLQRHGRRQDCSPGNRTREFAGSWRLILVEWSASVARDGLPEPDVHRKERKGIRTRPVPRRTQRLVNCSHTAPSEPQALAVAQSAPVRHLQQFHSPIPLSPACANAPSSSFWRTQAAAKAVSTRPVPRLLSDVKASRTSALPPASKPQSSRRSNRFLQRPKSSGKDSRRLLAFTERRFG
ncbi:uncharacterized protein IWZ02DRAFT_195651 [Phyllosticta citriasiana]|uniref:uncharacterized protein n=1 Tax=Phyllosticta citriasiana TaxID=595635 RepID=UPI0030FD633C